MDVALMIFYWGGEYFDCNVKYYYDETNLSCHVKEHLYYVIA